MSKDKPAKLSGDSTGADVEVEVEGLDIKDRTRLKPPRTLETTLFDRLEKLYGEGIKRVLKIQYRYAYHQVPVSRAALHMLIGAG